MFGTRSIVAVLLAVSLVGTASQAAAKDHRVSMAVTEVNGINANCAVPYGFELSYSSGKRLLKFGNKIRARKKLTRFTHKRSSESIGRFVTTTFNRKNKRIQVTETAVSLDSTASCKFVFQGTLRS
jgi:hypothetical protein